MVMARQKKMAATEGAEVLQYRRPGRGQSRHRLEQRVDEPEQAHM